MLSYHVTLQYEPFNLLYWKTMTQCIQLDALLTTVNNSTSTLWDFQKYGSFDFHVVYLSTTHALVGAGVAMGLYLPVLRY
jgi:hypothetical protein